MGAGQPEVAAQAMANFEAYYGYPSLKDIPKNPDSYRVEWQLATLFADATSEIARAALECLSCGLKVETKEKVAALIAQIHGIWHASRFGSFDAERKVIDPSREFYRSLPRPSPLQHDMAGSK
jgi:hypothetical protein